MPKLTRNLFQDDILRIDGELYRFVGVRFASGFAVIRMRDRKKMWLSVRARALLVWRRKTNTLSKKEKYDRLIAHQRIGNPKEQGK